jgi:hypothetical protein
MNFVVEYFKLIDLLALVALAALAAPHWSATEAFDCSWREFWWHFGARCESWVGLELG